MPFLLHFIRHRARLAVATLGSVIVGAACAVAAQYGLKMLVDGMANGHPDRFRVECDLGLFLGLLALESVFWRLGGWLGAHAVIRLGADIRSSLLDRLSARDLSFFVGRSSAALAGRITAASTAATAVASTLIWNIVPPCADLIGSVVILTVIDWRLAVGLIAAAVAATWSLRHLGLRGFPLHRRFHHHAAEVTGHIGDVIVNIALVKGFNGRDREHRKLRALLATEQDTHVRSWMFLEQLRCLHDISFWLITSALLIAAVRCWSLGTITTGDVVVATTLSLRVLNGSRELALSLLGLAQQLGAVSEAIDTLGQPKEPVVRPARPLHRQQGSALTFLDVTYAPEGGRVLFHNLNLHVPAGQRLGIVGESGAGKSTLLGLVQHLIEPQRGRVLLDGQAIDTVAPESLTEAFAVVTQEVPLFHRSVRENLCYGRPEASIGEIEQAAVAAGCHAFICQLPCGYDTIVGERGIRLSGGQRQRIAIARAFLKSAPVLLLDEATSALDSRSEAEVQAALLARSRNCTVLAVAHRLSTLSGFDRVIVLQGGRIVEDGSPGELIRASGPFGEMWRMQNRVASSSYAENADHVASAEVAE